MCPRITIGPRGYPYRQALNLMIQDQYSGHERLPEHLHSGRDALKQKNKCWYQLEIHEAEYVGVLRASVIISCVVHPHGPMDVKSVIEN